MARRRRAVLRRAAGQPLVLRRHAGYDHSYYFIASFVADHLAHHAALLGGADAEPATETLR